MTRNIAEPDKILSEEIVKTYVKDGQMRVDAANGGVFLFTREGQNVLYSAKTKAVYFYTDKLYKNFPEFKTDETKYVATGESAALGEVEVEIFEAESEKFKAQYWVTYDKKFEAFVRSVREIIQKSKAFYSYSPRETPWLKDDGFDVQTHQLRGDKIVDTEFLSLEEKELDKFLFEIPKGYAEFNIP
ncbi:MAG: hypothetical protein R3A80_11965 [Bdellovibrionota bacterium]